MQVAAKVLKTIPTYCASVEVVQEKYDAKQSTALHTDDCTAVQRGGQKQPPVIHRANSQDCTHQGKEKGGVYSLGKRSKVPGVILRKSYTRA